MSMPYLVAFRKQIAAAAAFGLFAGVVLAVVAASGDWSDGWAALGQMITLLAGITLVLYVFSRVLWRVVTTRLPGLGVKPDQPDAYVEGIAVTSCALLLCAAVLNVVWWVGPSQMW